MDDALTILEYMPTSFKNTAEQQYITFLWEAFESNYQNGKYQFAMLAFHMLYMSFVYFSVWQIKLGRPDDFAKAVIFQQKERELLSATSPFTFSEIQERGIFNFLRLIGGCEKQHTGQYAKLVDERNEIAHSNGNIFFSDQATADAKIAEILKQVAAIHTHMQPVIHDCLFSFLRESWNADEREYVEAEDEIREALVYTNYLSPKDIEVCRVFNISTLNDETHFAEITTLFDTFISLYPSEEE